MLLSRCRRSTRTHSRSSRVQPTGAANWRSQLAPTAAAAAAPAWRTTPKNFTLPRDVATVADAATLPPVQACRQAVLDARSVANGNTPRTTQSTAAADYCVVLVGWRHSTDTAPITGGRYRHLYT